MVGLFTYSAFLLVLTLAMGLRFGVLAGAASAILVPLIGVLGQVVRERWRNAWGDARRFFVLRSRREMVRALRDQQRKLSVRLEAVYQSSIANVTG